MPNFPECYYGTKYSSGNINAGTKSNAKYILILPPARKCQGLKRSEQRRHFPLIASGICIVLSYSVMFCMLTSYFCCILGNTHTGILQSEGMMQMESKFIILKVKNQSSRYQHLYVCNKVILTVFKTTLTKQVIVLFCFFFYYY